MYENKYNCNTSISNFVKSFYASNNLFKSIHLEIFDIFFFGIFHFIPFKYDAFAKMYIFVYYEKLIGFM